MNSRSINDTEGRLCVRLWEHGAISIYDTECRRRVRLWPDGAILLFDTECRRRVQLLPSGSILLSDKEGKRRIRLWWDGDISISDTDGNRSGETTIGGNNMNDTNDTLAKLLMDDESVYEPTRLPEVFAYLAQLRDRLFAAASAAEKEPLDDFGGISDSPLTSETAEEDGWYDDPDKLPETIRQIVLLRRAVKEAK